MPTIDEILDAMPEEEATTGRDYLVIDPSTRTITVPISEKVFGVEGDVDAQRKYFICPRYVGDNLDLASMFLSVYFRTATDYEDGYLVDDVAVNGDYVTFSWLLSSSITEHRGTVQFSVCADLPNSTNRRGPDWNTTIAQGDILEGLDPDVGDVEAETSDVVTQLRAEIAASTAAVEAAGAAQVDVVKAQGTNTTQEAVAAIQAQGAATNASIPADYAALAAQVDTLTRGRAAAIVCEAAGAAIQVQDASDDPLQGLRIFGKSTQDGTPTPDAPVEIVSLAAPVVRVAGKNLLPWPYRDGTTKTHGGLTYTVQEDGGVYVTGTVTAAESYFVFSDFNFGEKSVGMGKSNGVYFWTDCLYNVARHFTMLYFSQGNVVDRVYYPQVETGTEATEYEAPAGQTLTITTPGSLHGIPVASGGNYTDANGQQWICDEVDLARGVYVQRVKTVRLENMAVYDEAKKTFQKTLATDMPGVYNVTQSKGRSFTTHYAYTEEIWGDTSIRTGYVCNYTGILVRDLNFTSLDDFNAYLAENEVFVLYELEAPVETPLTGVEVQTFLAMHSNKPTTTVLNDTGAHMVLEYAADPKTYIDNKLAALAAANS